MTGEEARVMGVLDKRIEKKRVCEGYVFEGKKGRGKLDGGVVVGKRFFWVEEGSEGWGD